MEEKEKEAALREKLENKFNEEKREITEKDGLKKISLLENIIKNNQNDELVQKIGN